jgi:Nudix hydrolase domain
MKLISLCARVVPRLPLGIRPTFSRIPAIQPRQQFSSSRIAGAPDALAMLPYRNLPFESIEIDVDDISVTDTAEFGTRLWSTLSAVRSKGVNAVFLKVPMLFSHYIPVAG